MTKSYGMTVFCDDIRNEEGDKKTYVGVYSGEMIVDSSFPVVLPTFAFAITLLEPMDEPVSPVTLKIFAPGTDSDSEMLASFDLPSDRPQQPQSDLPDPQAQFRAAIIPVRVGPFVLHKAGYIKVRAYFGDEEVRLGSLRVRNLGTPLPQKTPF